MTCCTPEAEAGITSGSPGEEAIAISRRRTSDPVVRAIGTFRPWARLSAKPWAGAADMKTPDCAGRAGARLPFAGGAEKNSASIFARTSACSALARALGSAPADRRRRPEPAGSGVPAGGAGWPGTAGSGGEPAAAAPGQGRRRERGQLRRRNCRGRAGQQGPDELAQRVRRGLDDRAVQHAADDRHRRGRRGRGGCRWRRRWRLTPRTLRVAERCRCAGLGRSCRSSAWPSTDSTTTCIRSPAARTSSVTWLPAGMFAGVESLSAPLSVTTISSPSGSRPCTVPLMMVPLSICASVARRIRDDRGQDVGRGSGGRQPWRQVDGEFAHRRSISIPPAMKLAPAAARSLRCRARHRCRDGASAAASARGWHRAPWYRAAPRRAAAASF